MPSRRGINSQETASMYAEDIPEQPNSTCEEDSVRRKSSIAIAATLLAFRQREKMPRPSTPALHHPGNEQRSNRMSISIIAIPCEIYKNKCRVLFNYSIILPAFPTPCKTHSRRSLSSRSSSAYPTSIISRN